MPDALFHFYPDLNDFLSRRRRAGIFTETFQTGQSLKHLIEAAGVPHTEIGRVRAGSQTVDLDYQVQDGDQIAVYPPGPGAGQPEAGSRFVLDSHLGKLAGWLRILGFDSLYRNDFDDIRLAEISAGQDRILLTRDRRLLMRKMVRYGHCLRSLDSLVQVREVLTRYNLFDKINAFRRCLHCNGLLEPVRKAEVLDRLEPLTRRYYDLFHHCPNCGQIYWKGSHYEHMLETIATFYPDGMQPKT